MLFCLVVVVVASVLCFVQSCASALFCFKTLFMCFVFLFNKYPSFYAKKLSLKKPNLREARNWIAEQQFYREKKLVCRKSILPKKKKKHKIRGHTIQEGTKKHEQSI